MGRTQKQQGRERDRKKKAALKRHNARMARGKNRGPTFTLGDFQKRLKRALRQVELNRRSRLQNPYLKTLETPRKKQGLLSRIKGFFGRKKGPK